MIHLTVPGALNGATVPPRAGISRMDGRGCGECLLLKRCRAECVKTTPPLIPSQWVRRPSFADQPARHATMRTDCMPAICSLCALWLCERWVRAVPALVMHSSP